LSSIKLIRKRISCACGSATELKTGSGKPKTAWTAKNVQRVANDQQQACSSVQFSCRISVILI